jgi:hypothetical protein
MTTNPHPVNEEKAVNQVELADLLAELGARTKAVDKTIAANMSDSAYIQALRAVQNTATKVVDQVNRAR